MRRYDMWCAVLNGFGSELTYRKPIKLHDGKNRFKKISWDAAIAEGKPTHVALFLTEYGLEPWQKATFLNVKRAVKRGDAIVLHDWKVEIKG